MVYKEISPYLNKMVHVKLKNKKRKVGWLVIANHELDEDLIKEVHCVNVRFGEKYARHSQDMDRATLLQNGQAVQMKDILTIRSCL